MRIGSLFSGIGGLELGLEWAGLGPTLFQVERDPSCLHWLAQHWPGVLRFTDVRAVGAHNLPAVDVLCGGFPCQPHSVAGKREGADDERDLWPEYARIIRELRPLVVVAENVPGLLTSDDGRFFNRVLSDLAALGYDAEWDVLSAEEVGAPQLRERLFTIAWDASRVADAGRQCVHVERIAGEAAPAREQSLLAHPECCGEQVGNADSGRRRAGAGLEVPGFDGRCSSVGDTGRAGRQEHDASAEPSGPGHVPGERARVDWADAVRVRGYDGTVRVIPREAAETGPQSPLWPVAPGLPGRVARLRAIGNAVVPQVAEVVGRRVLEIAGAVR